ncbi:MAG: aminotransferase class IV [Actinomycetota bacterium]|nr:aminotransferase class IV [Actinomycetota bacterium]
MTDQPAPATVAASGELACLDGTIAPAAETVIGVLDDGFLRGDGAFEVIRVYDGRPFALSDHLDRLVHSAANLLLGDGIPREDLEREASELLWARGGGGFDGCLRLVLTRGGRRLLLTEPLPPSPERPRLGFVTYAPTRILDGVKSLSYAANMLASRLARERGFDEALLVTPHGRVLEAPTSSIFWVDGDGALCTPPLDDHILASITRGRVMRLVEVVERSLASDVLLHASEAFLASTTREVQTLGGVEERSFGEPGEATRAAAAALREHIEAELAGA